jgi:hypothetical protein
MDHVMADLTAEEIAELRRLASVGEWMRALADYEASAKARKGILRLLDEVERRRAGVVLTAQEVEALRSHINTGNDLLDLEGLDNDPLPADLAKKLRLSVAGRKE